MRLYACGTVFNISKETDQGIYMKVSFIWADTKMQTITEQGSLNKQ